jgi:mono/diheme cytochrome c family protein
MAIYGICNWRRVRHAEAPTRKSVDRLGSMGLCASLAIGGVVVSITIAVAADPPAAPVAVYTEAQAVDGRQVYFQTCANCHGEDLAGKVGPALTGRQFHQMVAAQKMTAPSLLQFIATQMPQTKPGSLTHTQCAAIMAFILAQNGYPSGSTPLTFDSQDLEKINLAAAPGGG